MCDRSLNRKKNEVNNRERLKDKKISWMTTTTPINTVICIATPERNIKKTSTIRFISKDKVVVNIELKGIMMRGKLILFNKDAFIKREFMPPVVASEKKLHSIIPERSLT